MQQCGDEAMECPGLDHPGQNKQEQPKHHDDIVQGNQSCHPDWIIRGGSSSRSSRPPDCIIQGQDKSTPSLQALAGVRLVASLLGHSCKITLCSRAQSQVDHWECPPCINKGADDTHSIMPEV